VSTAAPLAPSTAADPTVYPIEDDVGEGSLQRFISELLRPLIERWLVEKGRPAFVGADQYFYWKQFDPHESVAPDVYVLPGAPADARVGAWLVWKTGLVPTFAFEIVSDDVAKDYLRSPQRYDRLGVTELVVFDPDWKKSRHRFRFQIFRRTKARGFVRVEATSADRVRSRVLGCFLRSVGEGDQVRVRLAVGANGNALFPTEAERERTGRIEAEAEIERLRAELKKRR
jgi:Putative restriction endonuclease